MEPNETPTETRPQPTAYIQSGVVMEVPGPVKDMGHAELLALLTRDQETMSAMVLAIGTDGIRILKNRTGPLSFREFNQKPRLIMTPKAQLQTCWVAIPDHPGRYLRLQFTTEISPEAHDIHPGQETTTAADLITALQSITFRNLKFNKPS